MNMFVEKLEENKFKICGLITLFPVILLIKKKYMSGPRCTSKQRLDGKVAIITGCNSGIGKETALDFAKRGALVIMACRDLVKSKIVCDNIRKHSNNQNIFVEHLDLESFESVKTFSKKILNDYTSINILVNNGGVMGCSYAKTIDGFEKHFQINYLSHYLLTRLLIDRIKNTPESRIINVTSKLYETAFICWDDINMETNFEPVNCYKQSKLCNILFTNHLSRVLNLNDNIDVNVYSVSPGVVLTNLGRYFFDEFGTFKKIACFVFYPLIWFFMKTPENGAQTTIYCAVEPSIRNKSGGFYRNCKEQPLLSHAVNNEDERHLWEISEKYVEEFL